MEDPSLYQPPECQRLAGFGSHLLLLYEVHWRPL
jgi:hypothetical protein